MFVFCFLTNVLKASHCVSLSASGVLKGFDPLLNLVLDGTIEYMRGKMTEKTKMHRVPDFINV